MQRGLLFPRILKKLNFGITNVLVLETKKSYVV